LPRCGPSAPARATRGAGIARRRPKRYGGKGVAKAVQKCHRKNSPALQGIDGSKLPVDRPCLELDGTETKSNSAPTPFSRSPKHRQGRRRGHRHPAFQILGGPKAKVLPVRWQCHHGGAHSTPRLFQEFMIVPKGFDTYSEGLRRSRKFSRAEIMLKKKGLSHRSGGRGRFGRTRKPEAALETIFAATKDAGYGRETGLSGIGCGIFRVLRRQERHYVFKRALAAKCRAQNWWVFTGELVSRYPIVRIEDGCVLENELQIGKILVA